MKIIAETAKGFLIEATGGEIANTMGFYSPSTQGCPTPKVGMEIKISSMYDRLESIKYNSGKIRSAKKELKEILVQLEKLNVVLYEEKLSETDQ